LAAAKESSSEGNKQDFHVAGDRVPSKQASTPVRVAGEPFSDHDITIKGSIWSDTKGIFYVFNLAKDGHSFTLVSSDMVAAGYQVFSRGSCAVELDYKGEKRTVACLGVATTGGGEERLGSERRTTAGGSSAQSLGSNAPVQSVPPSGVLRGANITVVSDSSHVARTLN